MRTELKELLFWSRVVDTSEKPTQDEIEKLLDAQQAAQNVLHGQSKPDNEPNGKPQYYVSVCPDTNQQFLVEHGKDNNICELTMENAETIRRQFLHTNKPTQGKSRRASDLLAFLAEEHKRYRTEIEPMIPVDGSDYDSRLEDFDDAKNEFLESLWDVISQHFDDRETKNAL